MARMQKGQVQSRRRSTCVIRNALAVISLVLAIASLACGFITEQHSKAPWLATPYSSAQTQVTVGCSDGHYTLLIRRTVPGPVIRTGVTHEVLGFSYRSMALPSVVPPTTLGAGGATGALVNVVGVHYWFPVVLFFAYPILAFVTRLSHHYHRLGNEELSGSGGYVPTSTPAMQDDPGHQLAISRHGLRITLMKRLGVCLVLAALLTALMAAVPRFREPEVLGPHPTLPVRVAIHRIEFGWPDDMASYSKLICVGADGKRTSFDMSTVPPDFNPAIRQMVLSRVGWQFDAPDMAVVYFACLAMLAVGAAHGPLTTHWRTVGRILGSLCPACRYPLVGLPGPRCPECGAQI